MFSKDCLTAHFPTPDILAPGGQQLRGVADWDSAVPRWESLGFKTQEQGCSEHGSVLCSSSHTKISTESFRLESWRSWSPIAFHKATVAGPVWLSCKCCMHGKEGILPKQSQVLRAAMRCQHRPLFVCRAFHREKGSQLRVFTRISAKANAKVGCDPAG